MKIKTSNAIILHEDKFLLLLRDNKETIPNPNKWSLIGGQIDEGETNEIAMLREAEEEISVRPASCVSLGSIITPDGVGHAIFFIKLSDVEASSVKLGNEGQKIDFFTLHEMGELDLTPNLSLFYEKYSEYLNEVIRMKTTPDPKKLGLQ